ncbi:MAG: nucleotidyltransferase [Bacteroidetes bacterium]|nr:MAG: nucleotidyltransferase [Bacteroidota bacterium]REK04686.1 MAG: nucleotidyltransferase [Bacteroidota bacterium]REK36161.1 MAG: nucleotidyltransferase [Bacteroidota bacterium]REK51468.1 MAG: nucleotidyltransferase [Bacteroidota bacterium]
MKIIVPMAGMGKRMRPHTLTVPKPLIPVAGKPIVQWLVEDITKMCNEKVDEIAYIIGDFGKEVENDLLRIAASLGAKGSIYYQDEPLGTAHAIMCAKDSLKGKVIVAFADTLFRADFKIDSEMDGVIWVSRIDDPKMFGVVKLDNDGVITDFVEKPQEFISDLAIIGIYYFRDGDYLRSELQYLLDNNIREKGEYQLTNALENMKKKGTRFVPGKVDEWLDCGNKDATVYTNKRVLEIHKDNNMVAASAKLHNSVIIPPCFVGDSVELVNTVLGPHVSIGSNSKVQNSVISNSIIQSNTSIQNSILDNSMIGHYSEFVNKPEQVSLSDYSSSR